MANATINAARECATTLLFHSLRIQAFHGAAPHVMLVADRQPCVLQKVLLEGYRQVLDAHNGLAAEAATAWEDARQGHLLVSLHPDTLTPCGSCGLREPGSHITYSVLPFHPTTFMQDVAKLQAFLRQCGTPVEGEAAPTTSPPRWSDEEFNQRLRELAPYLQTLQAVAGGTRTTRMEDGAASTITSHLSEDELLEMGQALRRGPQRELLGFVLLQRNAFQNDMKKYRLRLSLFDMGMRVVEHCHLECMSTAADALAAEDRLVEALQDDQIFSYPRSCSLRPAVTEAFAKAIADSIDLFAWKRASTGPLPSSPPPSFAAVEKNEEVWALFRQGALTWTVATTPGARGEGREEEEEGEAGAAAATAAVPFEAAMSSPIIGPGAPLKIVCRDPTHTLTFSGGLEDCLMNTGYYAAAEQEERNEVHAHRQRFPPSPQYFSTGPAEPSSVPEEETHPPLGEVKGRLKKKDYLALLKQRGEKPNKKPRHDSDNEGDDGTARPRGSCIATSIGGTFPIGEVISESFDLSQLNGTCHVFAYPDPFKQVAMSPGAPFEMTITNGVVSSVGPNAPADFVDLWSLVAQTEGACYVRELGIGLNPFLSLSHVLSDVTAFERQWGIHLSLGQRHPLFVKQPCRRNPDGSTAEAVTVVGPVLKRKAGKYHIDVFIDVASLSIGNLTMDFTKGLVLP